MRRPRCGIDIQMYSVAEYGGGHKAKSQGRLLAASFWRTTGFSLREGVPVVCQLISNGPTSQFSRKNAKLQVSDSDWIDQTAQSGNSSI